MNLCFTSCVSCVYDWPNVLTSGVAVWPEVRVESELNFLAVSSPLCQVWSFELCVS